MTNQSARQGLLSMGSDRAAIEIAAGREASLAGHAEVGFEHLLLGALVSGGPGARHLMDAGLDLTEARAAIRTLMRDDLALLDIDTSLTAQPGGKEEAVRLPQSERVSELLVDCPWAGGDVALIAALIDDEGGRVRRLLERSGVDPDLVREGLDGLSPDPAEPVGAADPGSVPDGWDSLTYEREVPVSAARLWALVSDPERRAEWEPGPTEARVVGDGAVDLVSPDQPVRREAVTHRVEGREIVWTRGDEGASQALLIVVEPLGERARLRVRRSWPSALRHRRIANRLLHWIVRKQLRIHVQTITQAAA
ncbi:SRPBCC family protein [Nocardiopsis prasina]|uniref:SRPBCC family protein n=1 Tax=Nocardiopsis prasina TaxID=2015 RepID=UPI000347EF31|nr:Clp protease N-terminal domain-containing protein [Nocardiopsis prasina]